MTRFKLTYGAVAVVLSIAGTLSAQSKPKADNLIVYGKDFAFRVKEPDGWRGDTGEIAKKYHVNAIFLPSTGESVKNDVTIRVGVNKKEDEKTVEDLNYDMAQYKRQFPTAQFSDLHVAHSDYKTFAKTVFVQHQFYEYVAYLNPGLGKPFSFSVAMSKKNAPATEEELKAYESVLQSVLWLTSSVVVK